MKYQIAVEMKNSKQIQRFQVDARNTEDARAKALLDYPNPERDIKNIRVTLIGASEEKKVSA